MRALGIELNIYAVPALITLVLLSVETLFLAAALPETRGIRHNGAKYPSQASKVEKPKTKSPARTIQERLDLLRTLRWLHFFFLGIFSGVEFTLTFLTFDRTSSPCPTKYQSNSCFYSFRLEQQPEWSPHWFHWNNQCFTPRWVRAPNNLQSGRRKNGEAWRNQLRRRTCVTLHGSSFYSGTLRQRSPPSSNGCCLSRFHIGNGCQLTYIIRIFAMR